MRVRQWALAHHLGSHLPELFGSGLMTDALIESKVDPIEYAQGLLGEEMGEVAALLGKARRFGLDTPGPDCAPYFGMTAREGIEFEIGDVLAAVDYAVMAGLLNREFIEEQRRRKLAKLLDPEKRDNLGRRLAPALRAQSQEVK
jgi:NTP pyrophosphatase (non-canonical NTP hydrolase)